MKLILTKDVPTVGDAGDVVEVKDGYGRNYLVPQGFATIWSKSGQKQVDAQRRIRHERELANLDHAQQTKEQLEAASLRVEVNAGEGGRLFGAVTAADIVAAVVKSGGPDLDKRRVELADPIKEVGEYDVSVRLHPEVSANVKLQVAAE